MEYWYLRSFVEKLYAPIFMNILWNEEINKILWKCHSYNHNCFSAPSDVENFRNLTKDLFKDMHSFKK